jgi:Transposase
VRRREPSNCSGSGVRRRRSRKPSAWPKGSSRGCAPTRPSSFAPWLLKARASTLLALRHFAEKLEAAIEAVRAAVSLPWSNGPVEGQISRLKMLKRQTYGRANLDLLNRRFLLLAAVSPKVAKNPI